MSTSAVPLQHIEQEDAWATPSKGRLGMWSLIVAESAIFLIFVVAYIYYMGRDVQGPTPKQVLETPVLGTVCLLSSSLFIYLAEHAIARGRMAAFRLWWAVTFALGAFFLLTTAREWHKLITVDHLTVATNLFGTTYYSLVGLHAFHVVVGLLLLLTVLLFAFTGHVQPSHAERVQILALYWHFVDAVWVVVFSVVYIAGLHGGAR